MIRRLSMVIALAFAAALVPAAAAQADSHRDSVKIFAIVYNPHGPDHGHNLRNELIILKNTSWHAVSLKGWTVADKDHHEYTFDWVVLKKGDFITLHTGKGFDTKRHVFWDKKREVWDNDHDTAFLFNKKDKLVDKCRYHGTWSGVKFCK